MHIQGWAVTGLDVSSRVVERIRAELGLRALAGTLPHPKLALERFDLVTMWMSLEHMHQPGRVLRECYRLLVPGGKVLVAVPNIESSAFRWFGTAWSCLDLPRHLTHFSPNTLRKMLEQAGFEVRSTRMLRRSQWLRDSAQLARRVGHKTRWSGLLQHQWPSRLAASYSVWTRQSDAMLMTAVKPEPSD
jgi:2-polyprenyl-3-methyl-5-hydroxy-6-metoxy-1,4-benzoquinol methylase